VTLDPDSVRAPGPRAGGNRALVRGADLDLDGGSRADLSALLRASWLDDLAAGRVVYDPRHAGVHAIGDYRFHFVPGRAVRPGSWSPAPLPAEGLFLPHRPCPFDGDDIATERQILRVRRGGRVYQVISNRFPVTWPHFLGVRPFDAVDPVRLRQHLHGVAEVEDLLLLAAALGPGMRVFFNSNRGADGSHAGSSINHWHFQFFPCPVDCREPLAFGALSSREDAPRPDGDRGVRCGQVAGWPARHRAYDAHRAAIAAAARLAWEAIAGVHARNGAYNLEIIPRPDGVLRTLLFPRRAAEPERIPSIGMLGTNFGGWELSGDFVIPDRAIFDWLAEHRDAALEIARRRLAATTRDD